MTMTMTSKTHTLLCFAAFFLVVTVSKQTTVQALELHVQKNAATHHHKNETSSTKTSSNAIADTHRDRQLTLLSDEPFYTTDDLGLYNPMAAIGNPMKGLMGGGLWTWMPLPDEVPASIEWYVLELSQIIIGHQTYNWTYIDQYLEGAASRDMHVAFSVFIVWPGSDMKLPTHLIDQVEYRTCDDNDITVPYFGDTNLLDALNHYIHALGQQYDGDTRIYLIQLGLLGYWGEFHTYPCDEHLPQSCKDLVATWYIESFNKTEISIRYPMETANGMGLTDHSFAYTTLDGDYAHGEPVGWYFWPKVVSEGQTDFWKNATMGGETRPEIQDEVFLADYQAPQENKQWFMDCVHVTHASSMVHHDAFVKHNIDGEYKSRYEGTELENARFAHANMGYNFQVTYVAAARSATNGLVEIEVEVMQKGVAPFYYELNLALSCVGYSQEVVGVNELIEESDTKLFLFEDVPATQACMNAITLSLESPYAYTRKPVRFAQGTDGTVVALSIELPFTPAPTVSLMPSEVPSAAPTESPTKSSAPSSSPVAQPSGMPSPSTSALPSPAPTPSPSTKPSASPSARPSSAALEFIRAEELPGLTSNGYNLKKIKGLDNTWIHQSNSAITNEYSYPDEEFQVHRGGKDRFIYEIYGFGDEQWYQLTIGFAETDQDICNEGIDGRVMDIKVEGGYFARDLDIYKEVGCNVAYTMTKIVRSNNKGRIKVEVKREEGNPMFSFMEFTDEQSGSARSSVMDVVEPREESCQDEYPCDGLLFPGHLMLIDFFGVVCFDVCVASFFPSSIMEFLGFDCGYCG